MADSSVVISTGEAPAWLRLFQVVVFSAVVWATGSNRVVAADINNWVNNAETGVFLMRSGDGEPVAATTLNTEVDIDINGPVAHVSLTQYFHNQGQAFAEGLYVFPLSERAAVRAMALRIGERRIVGEIHEKHEARQIFEQAKAEGKRTGLVEQRRANVFTTAVANIAPDEMIAVTLEYIEVLEREENQFHFRLPMTLTPRYCPPLERVATADLPVDEAEDDELFYQSRMPDISGPYFDAGVQPPGSHYAQIRINLNGGARLSQLHSRSHQILTQQDGSRYRITPEQIEVPMDRDFLMSWTLAPERDATATVFTETVAGEDYALLMIVPPAQVSDQARLQRETLFIIDTSGSMGGESIRQAKSALQEALKRLRPGDRFNIVEFNSDFSSLYGQPHAVTPNALDEAQRFVAKLSANGGTEMLAPLQAALSMPQAEAFLRQLVFITDGAVGNEQAIFQALHQQLGAARLFTVGIGSAPNNYFMRKAAEFGRGSFTYINSLREVQTQMSRLFARLEKPLMRDISVTLPRDVTAEMFPDRVPDLYAGEPLMLAMKFDRLPERIDLKGRGNVPWSASIAPQEMAHQSKGIAALWARQKIEALTDRISRGEAEENLRPEITSVALQHSLLSRYTSFVAVDRTPNRTAEQDLKRQDIANMLPKGLAWPKTATGVDALWRLSSGLFLGCLALLWRLRRSTDATV
jgi:Ca-activated chloride channel homolog